MYREFRLQAIVVLTILLLVSSGLEAAQCHSTHGKMICHCAERGMVCLCPILSCPQCANNDDIEEEDRATDIFFHFSNIAVPFQCSNIVYKKFAVPQTVFPEVPENPPRISCPAKPPCPVSIDILVKRRHSRAGGNPGHA
ncbi:MAG: hypothetical protein HY787_30035 [Deltaproteobacteria bacterium]|nr:hypothetical protein [Deltaproteobacteria bacterium]